MSAPFIEYVSQSVLEARKDELLRRGGLSLADLRSRAETYAVTPEQRDILDAVEDIDYLLAR
ncbi:hypothetical protein [Arthrobacter pascens]|uniref:hypothetical protein n=1 Tax=Arthrobacter pascens TaxID=1677 RepID=UPI00196B5480|nr:hypothetical protein [Arthrobacter pascens]MBN3497862.1 hypothetical protein [Arthrobacter pascens]